MATCHIGFRLVEFGAATPLHFAISGHSICKEGSLNGLRLPATTLWHAIGFNLIAHRWSGEVTRHSNALDLEPGVFNRTGPHAIAHSLRHSAESSERCKIFQKEEA